MFEELKEKRKQRRKQKKERDRQYAEDLTRLSGDLPRENDLADKIGLYAVFFMNAVSYDPETARRKALNLRKISASGLEVSRLETSELEYE